MTATSASTAREPAGHRRVDRGALPAARSVAGADRPGQPGRPPPAVLVAAVLTVLLAGRRARASRLGTPYVAPVDVLRALSGAGTPYDLVVLDLRLPRVVLAAAAGAAFGIAGTLIQSVARNPLASPDVIGITQGAGLAATVALTSGAAAVAGGARRAGRRAARGGRCCWRSAPGTGWPRSGSCWPGWRSRWLAGAHRGRHAHRRPDRRAARADLADRHPGRQGLDRGGWIAGTLLVLLPVLVWAGWALNSTALDDDTARGVGLRPVARRIGLAATGVLAAAMVTAQVGAVDFVALVAPAGGPPAGPRRTAAAGLRRAASARSWSCSPTWPADGCSHPPNCPPAC